MLAGIKVEIVRINQKAEYQGTVFDQSVTVRLPDDSKMGLFDKDILVDDELTGEECTVVLSLLSTISHVVDHSNPKGIEPNSADPEGWSNHVYSGEVVEILEETETGYELRLEVGYGDVVVHLDGRQFNDSPAGCFLEVTAMRSDVYSVLE
ncbi:hypothetical protein [Halogranum rubrum]|uniref:hypothetical protein n=1 Tax=Halogranum rubrum TaxID=553466 RepID=UPI00067759B1|nr:hypothetical protein [Halogranum salarium]